MLDDTVDSAGGCVVDERPNMLKVGHREHKLQTGDVITGLDLRSPEC